MELVNLRIKNSEHISLLRRAFSERMSGSLKTKCLTGETFSLKFSQGGMVGCELEIEKNLGKFLSLPLAEMSWEDNVIDVSYGWVSPRIILSNVLMAIPMDDQILKQYYKLLSQLSDVTFKLKPIHFSDYGDYVEYQNLYAQSTKTKELHVADYFISVESKIILERRIRVMLLVYLLGMLKKTNRPARKHKYNLATVLTMSRTMRQMLLVGT